MQPDKVGCIAGIVFVPCPRRNRKRAWRERCGKGGRGRVGWRKWEGRGGRGEGREYAWEAEGGEDGVKKGLGEKR